MCVSWLRFRIWFSFFFFQAEDGIRDLVRSRGLGDVYKRQVALGTRWSPRAGEAVDLPAELHCPARVTGDLAECCLLYTSDAADERSSVDLGGRRIIKKKTTQHKTLIPSERHREI